ncbi:MAG: rhomboid family intramembrane serine protease [Myxococcaceae bacterium]|nr:rhomboid family intramembrane serine protease [Myxococcaceae bacterium]MCI0672514.1 rhomboid family intramembrane serine protease [Myxococcaceae bacterium]
MIPISDDNPTLRTPWMTYLILATLGVVWFRIQGAGFNGFALASSVCNLGMVPGELTGLAPVGLGVPLGEGLACVVDRESINLWTPLTSMFLHGGWSHILGNALFLWVFGNNVEDSMGRVRFLVFYVLCGLIAAATHVFLDPGSPVPTVGASGAISGVMGGYLLLYPRVRVNMILPPFIFWRFPLPAWAVLIYWFILQVVGGLPQLMQLRPEVSGSGVAFWAHIGGFVAGVVLVKLFENPELVRVRTRLRHRYHPYHP